MFCPFCGKQNNDNSKYCVYCGAKIGNDSIQKRKKGYKNRTIVSIIFFLSVLLLVILYISNNLNKKNILSKVEDGQNIATNNDDYQNEKSNQDTTSNDQQSSITITPLTSLNSGKRIIWYSSKDSVTYDTKIDAAFMLTS